MKILDTHQIQAVSGGYGTRLATIDTLFNTGPITMPAPQPFGPIAPIAPISDCDFPAEPGWGASETVGPIIECYAPEFI